MDQGPKAKKTVMSRKENTREMCLDIGVGFWEDVLPKIYTIYIYVYIYMYICMYVRIYVCKYIFTCMSRYIP